MRLLLVENEGAIRLPLATNLREAGCAVDAVGTPGRPGVWRGHFRIRP